MQNFIKPVLLIALLLLIQIPAFAVGVDASAAESLGVGTHPGEAWAAAGQCAVFKVSCSSNADCPSGNCETGGGTQRTKSLLAPPEEPTVMLAGQCAAFNLPCESNGDCPSGKCDTGVNFCSKCYHRFLSLDKDKQ